MKRRLRPAQSVLACALAWLIETAAAAQGVAPLQPSARDLALAAMAGRFRSPVQCRMPDGALIEREEAVVFEIDPSASSGRPGLRATFFGIDAPGAIACFNLLERRLPDRRGVLYLHVRGHPRPDLAALDLRRMLADGELTYHVHRGELRIRPIGEPDAAERRVRFGSGDQRMEVRAVQPGSAAHKLLEHFSPPRAHADGSIRRLSLAFFGPDDLRFELHTLEDPGRAATRTRSP